MLILVFHLVSSLMNLRHLLFISLLFIPMVAVSGNKALYEKLDGVLENRPYFVKMKEKRISKIKESAFLTSDTRKKIELYSTVVEEYTAFDYDSAMVYVNRVDSLVKYTHDIKYILYAKYNRFQLYCSRGYYSLAQDLIRDISIEQIPPSMLFKYYYSYYALYTNLTYYYDDPVLSKSCARKRDENLVKCIEYCPKGTSLYYYLLGEYYNFTSRNFSKLEKYYMKSIQMSKPNDRQHAQSLYALALCYKESGDTRRYEQNLVESAISDHMIPVRENVALQDVAMLFLNERRSLSKAQYYINISLEDAMKYRNRLRIYEISQKMPIISNAYQHQLDNSKRWITIALAVITLFAIALATMYYLIIRQAKALSRQKHSLLHINKQLVESSQKEKQLNDMLINVNNRREDFAKLYVDLCAKYINKLYSYHQLVIRKLRANQQKDLLIVNPLKFTSEEQATFLNYFDRTFLYIYPSFVEEFNALLDDAYQIKVSPTNLLTPELRIFALIRLGVTNVTDISLLLFLSTRTVYNYKSETKKHAKDKDSFERDLMHISQIVRE